MRLPKPLIRWVAQLPVVRPGPIFDLSYEFLISEDRISLSSGIDRGLVDHQLVDLLYLSVPGFEEPAENNV